MKKKERCVYCGKNHKDINCPIIGSIAKGIKDYIDHDIIEKYTPNIHTQKKLKKKISRKEKV